MDTPNALALIVAYYLSRFDTLAYEALGFHTSKATHAAIGQALGIKASTVKNMRDEFDPLHDNPRKGWYQRELWPSRQKVVEMFGEMEEAELYSIVLGILQDAALHEADDMQDIIKLVVESDRKESLESASPAARMRTGHLAEDYFIEFHTETGQPKPGLLQDTRYRACGYDFEIENKDTTFVEVKGMADRSGGILFTDKEWRVAVEKADAYVVALVRNVVETPDISFIWNPAAFLKPRQRLYTTVQTSWTVPGAQLP